MQRLDAQLDVFTSGHVALHWLETIHADSNSDRGLQELPTPATVHRHPLRFPVVVMMLTGALLIVTTIAGLLFAL